MHLLAEIDSNICYCAKAVDDNNPIPSTQMPRGYEGVSVLWESDIDHLVNQKHDGNERIQCIELKLQKPILIISAYLPTKGYKDSTQTFKENIDCLYEIIQKYHASHEVIIGGDLNEDLSNEKNQSDRLNYLRELIHDCDLHFTTAGNTYVHPNGKDCTEIDYFLYSHEEKVTSTKTVLLNLSTNVSDHYPIQIKFNVDYTKRKAGNINTSSKRIKWDKVDLDLYSAMVDDAMKYVNVNHCIDNEKLALNTCTILQEAVKKSAPKPRQMKSKPKLKVWSTEISQNINSIRIIHKRIQIEGNKSLISETLINERKTMKKNLRTEIRQQTAIREKKRKLWRQEIRSQTIS